MISDKLKFFLILIINLISFCLAISTSFLIDDLFGVFLHNSWILFQVIKLLYYWKFLVVHVTYKMYFLPFFCETAILALYIVYWSKLFSKSCHSEKSACSAGLTNMILFIIIYTMDLCIIPFMFVSKLRNKHGISRENDKQKDPVPTVSERGFVGDEESNNRENLSTDRETGNNEMAASSHTNDG